MKRILCALIMLSVLSGCSGYKNSFVLNRESMSNSFHAKLDSTEYEGRMTFDGNLNMILTFTFPDDIAGYTLTFCKDSVTASYDNVDDSYDFNDFSDSFAFLEIYKALKYAAECGGFVRNDDSSYKLTAQGASVVADRQGNITSAAVRNGHFIFGL